MSNKQSRNQLRCWNLFYDLNAYNKVEKGVSYVTNTWKRSSDNYIEAACSTNADTKAWI